MKILYVIDQMSDLNNDITKYINVIAEELRKVGNTVYLIGNGRSGENNIFLEKYTRFSNFLEKYEDFGFIFAKFDRAKVEKIVKKVDIVYFATPFGISRKIYKIAKKYRKKVRAGALVVRELIKLPLSLNENGIINHIVDRYLNSFYNKIKKIHSTNKYIAEELVEELDDSIISNIPYFVRSDLRHIRKEKPTRFEDRYVILSIGRFNSINSQKILIDAIKNSKYEKVIQLIFLGEGQIEESLKKRTYKLTNLPVFDDLDYDEIYNIMGYSDLYVHTSKFDTEIMFLLENMACGRVPLVPDNERSLAKTFALDDKSTYNYEEPKSLAKKIDFWIEHHTFKLEYEEKYAKYMDKYKVGNNLKKIEKFLADEKE